MSIQHHEIDDSLRDVMSLLVMYPMDSLQLNPWEVAQIFYSYKKSQKQAHLTLTRDLPAVFQLFSATFGTSSEHLAQYFGAFYSKNGRGHSVMHENVRTALQSPVLCALLSYKSVKLLSSNEDLIKWEFVRCLSHQRGENPFLEEVVHPLLSQRNFAYAQKNISSGGDRICHYVLTTDSALFWAKENAGLSTEQAQLLLFETCVMSGTSPSCGLTFSSFVIFSLRCFYLKTYGHSNLDTSVDEERTDQAIRAFLFATSIKLTKVQQIMKLKILKPLFGQHQLITSPLDKLESEALISCSISLCDKYSVNGVTSQKWAFLPPKPPSYFWDAPRVVELFRFLGIVERSGSLSTSWIAFGRHLSSTRGHNSGWGNFVVPPVPINLDVSSFEGILMLVCDMCHEEDEALHAIADTSKGKDSVTRLYWSYLCDTVLPLSISYAEKLHLVNTNDEGRNMLLLSDLLRYGGARAMHSLFASGVWLEQTFDHIASGHDADSIAIDGQREPLLTHAIIFFACAGLIQPADVALQAKKTLHGRFSRESAAFLQKTAPLTVSFAEFEELFLRCSLQAWVQAADSYDASQIAGIWRATDPGLYYLDEYNRQQQPVANESDTKTWGVDFVSAYFKTLVFTTESLNRNGKLVDSAHKRSREISKPRLDAFRGSYDVTYSAPNPAVRSNEPVSPLGSIEALVQTKLVQDKADTLLQDILDTRSSSPQTSKYFYSLENDQDREVSVASGSEVNSVDKEYALCSSPTRSLLAGTKEALWPVYGTYCSCGDSVDPGKLSGPNLFALLSKLGVLTDNTLLSDIGILLHQISAHTHSSSVSIASTTSSETYDSPSLSFEEFLVFLCAFAQLRFDGKVSAPILSGESKGIEQLSSASSQNTEVWFQNWKTFMGNSQAFRRLMEEGILPMLRRHPLLAYPQDARHRDKYSSIFSLEALLAIENSEERLMSVFRKHEDFASKAFHVNSAVEVMQRVGLVPNVVSAIDVIQLLTDVAPDAKISRSSSPTSPGGSLAQKTGFFGSELVNRDITLSERGRANIMNFPQWEWIFCVVSHQAVEQAVADCVVQTPINKIPPLVRDFINSVAHMLTSGNKHQSAL